MLIETKVTIFSAVYLALKNAAAVVIASIPVFYATVALPDLPLNAALWGTLGGLLRWLITKCGPAQGSLYMAIGGLMASGFDNYKIPFLSQILPPEATAQHAAPFFIGTFGIIIYGVFEDLLKGLSSKGASSTANFIKQFFARKPKP